MHAIYIWTGVQYKDKLAQQQVLVRLECNIRTHSNRHW